jgi:hypothetical protein
MMALALSATASASDGVVAPKSFYFQCNPAPALVTNFFATVPWTEAAPTTSLQEGGGCYTADTTISGTAPGNTFYDFVADGGYKGEVAQIDVTLFGTSLEYAAVKEATTSITVVADGEVVAQVEEVPGQVEALADVPNTFKGTWTLPLEQPLSAQKDDREWQVTVTHYYLDVGQGGWARGASEVPAGVKFYDIDDLPPVEEEEEF